VLAGTGAGVGSGSEPSTNFTGCGIMSAPWVRYDRKAEAVLELRVVGQGLGCVHRRDRGVDGAGPLDPLVGGPGPEDLGQLGPHLRVAPGVVAVLVAGPPLEHVGRPTPLQKFFQNSCSEAMNNT